MKKQERKPDISIVILCYRAEEYASLFARRVLQELDKEGVNFEIILVANYFPHHNDRTPEIVRHFSKNDERVATVSMEKKGMFGWDVKSGLSHARGKYVMFLDGDGQIAAETIVRTYQTAVKGGYDLVQAFRSERGDGIMRKIVSKTFNHFARFLFPKIRLRDINAKPKLFSKEVLNDLVLTADNWFIDTEMTIQASYRDYRLCEVPITFLSNTERKSFVRIKDLFAFIFDLVKYRLKTLLDKAILYEYSDNRRGYGRSWGSVRVAEERARHHNI